MAEPGVGGGCVIRGKGRLVLMAISSPVIEDGASLSPHRTRPPIHHECLVTRCIKRIWWRATSTKGDVLALPDPSVGLQWLRPPDRAPKQPEPLPWPALTIREDFDRGLRWASTATPCVQFTSRSWERTPALAVGKERTDTSRCQWRECE